MSEKSSGEILVDMTDQIYKSVTASGTYEMMIICPLLVSFEDEDSEKKLSTQIIDYKNAFDYFMTNSPNKDKFLVYPFLGFDKIHYNNVDFNKTIDFISSYIKKPGVIQNGEFIGIKFYPQINLDIDTINPEFFKYCEAEQIPLTVHCAYNPRNFLKAKGFISKDCNITQANALTDPLKWERLIERHNLKNLRLNLAHFEGESWFWMNRIKNMLSKYENIYTDLSFYLTGMTLFRGKREKINYTFTSRVKRILKNDTLRSKILYGSDYYPSIMRLSPL